MHAQDLLFELRTEELPPRTLLGLSTSLTTGMLEAIDAAGIAHGTVHSFATPRRLAFLIENLSEGQPDRATEKRGPPVSACFDAQGAPTQAATAFAKNCGVTVAELGRLSTDKGTWLQFKGIERGAKTVALLASMLDQSLASLPIAKRMRWGSREVEFVRPVHGVVLLYGEAVVPVKILGLASDRVTYGHRFHAPQPITLKNPAEYVHKLRQANVIVDFSERREAIRAGVKLAAVATARNRPAGEPKQAVTALIETALLDEVTALVEWPVPVAGEFERRFLSLPREVVIATIQDHQRYFAVQDAESQLTGWFVTVSNIESRDPSKVRAGNERVVRPRLSDAAFFWAQDRQLSLEQHAQKLRGVTFQAQLGSYADKTARVGALARGIGTRIGAGPEVGRAAALSKADLMTALVGEFPELQGVMGRYYATAEGLPQEIAVALEEHYRPRFAGDAIPTTATGQAVALADKLDTLVGIFAIEQRPTGTKDPFGLRRAALGVLRILLEADLDLDLVMLLRSSAASQPVQRSGVADEVYDFIMERLRGLLLEQPGTTSEMLDAVLATRLHSPLDVTHRLAALKAFLLLPDASVLAAINKRIVNILKKTSSQADARVDRALLRETAEQDLHGALERLRQPVLEAVEQRRYSEGLHALVGLRSPVDDFFDGVMVMDEDLSRRNNRLALLRDVQQLLSGVADLSRLPG